MLALRRGGGDHGGGVSGDSERGLTRRAVLTAGAVLSSAVLAACASADSPSGRHPTRSPRSAAPSDGGTPSASPGPTPTPTPTPTPAPADPPQPAPVLSRVPAPDGVITGLPGDGNLLAWTADDGTSSAVVAAYAAFAAATGIRLTLFATGCYDAWGENQATLQPLVASGQVQIANHTWTHPDLTALSDQGVVDELQRTHDRIGELYGVDARPFFRPPYGYYDDRVLGVAASIGYTTPTLWYGSLSDSGLIAEQQIVDLATQWFLPQHIVIGHLNFEPVTHVFPQLREIIRQRGLTTVTLNDVFTSEYHP